MRTKLSFRSVVIYIVCMAISVSGAIAAGGAERSQLDPCGKVHIPIGIANSLDTLKTFVEAEGNFSPGVGSYGVYFWIFDKTAGRLVAPTMDGVKCEHGLADGRYLIPWSRWSAGNITIKTEVCQVKRSYSDADVFIVGSRATINNTGDETRDISLYVALRPLGPAGFDVKELAVGEGSDALLVDGRPAIVAAEKPSEAGVLSTDTIGELALVGRMPVQNRAVSQQGDCSGALYYNLRLSPGSSKTLNFVCPVLPGRRAAGHQWDGVSEWAQFDLARLNPSSGGVLQPDPGLEYYRKAIVSSLFDEAGDYWKQLTEKISLDLPDARWEGAFAAIIAHAAMEMKGWYAFDEGGKSGPGGWGRLRTTWNSSVAMPHGWAIAELWLLMRDCLVFENDERLVLLSGVPPAWVTHEDGIMIEGLPTYFGKLNLQWKFRQGGATLILDGATGPPKGFLLRLPKTLKATVTVNGRNIPAVAAGQFILPPQTKLAYINFDG